MALQHFYSRIPARVSMYNRADSFDTFAHSDGLDREFIERELSVMYDGKLGKNDMTAVRKGEIPPVYSQCCLRSGKTVQTCITYLPLDYTGERSAYLAHSLILTDEEYKTLFCNKNNAVFNSDMFLKDISAFNITSPDAAPNKKYPELDYVPVQESTVRGAFEGYDPETVKTYIYAVLLSLCGKGKNVCFRLPRKSEDLSLRSLALINETFSILPYCLRRSLSFVSYVNDPLQYSSFKLKALSQTCPDVSPAKNVYFDFQTGLVIGIQHDEVTANKPLINFFYSLLENIEVRNEFLMYMDRAVEAMPNLANLNLKTLTDLVFLFLQTSGLFSEQSVLPNDAKVYDFLCIYEKYRAALSDEYRMRAYKCIERYPQRHEAIPKNIFSKVIRLYSTEIKPAKRIAMNSVLELIHTDIMREKLFAFIKSNYDKEEHDIKEIIVSNLCRVFYGGFLQANLLEFFSRIFVSEPQSTQDQIVDKLLLTIRTASVQQKILAFFDEHYDELSESQRSELYDTFFEMLHECDSLALSLVALVDRHISKEMDETVASISDRLAESLEINYKKKEHGLLPILTAQPGFCRDVTLKLTFGKWSTRKIFPEYMALLAALPAPEKTETVIHIFDLVPDMTEQVSAKMTDAAETLYKNDIGKLSLYAWIDTDITVKNKLSRVAPSFVREFHGKVIKSAVCTSIYDVFKTKYRSDGITVLLEYAKENPFVYDSDKYEVVSSYVDMISAIESDDLSEAFGIFDKLPQEPRLRADMALHMASCVLNRNEQSLEETLALDIMIAYLKSAQIPFDKLYSQYSGAYTQSYLIKHGAKADPAKATEHGAFCATELLLGVLLKISSASESMKALICGDTSRLDSVISSFVNAYGKNAANWLGSHMSLYEEVDELAEYLKGALSRSKPQGSSIWSKLFGKRR